MFIMSCDEIRRSCRVNGKSRQHLSILAQLNSCSITEIREILSLSDEESKRRTVKWKLEEENNVKSTTLKPTNYNNKTKVVKVIATSNRRQYLSKKVLKEFKDLVDEGKTDSEIMSILNLRKDTIARCKDKLSGEVYSNE